METPHLHQIRTGPKNTVTKDVEKKIIQWLIERSHIRTDLYMSMNYWLLIMNSSLYISLTDLWLTSSFIPVVSRLAWLIIS